MAGAESDRRDFVEHTATGVRNVGIVIGLIGMADAPIGATLFVDGVLLGGAGKIGRRAAMSRKPTG